MSLKGTDVDRRRKSCEGSCWESDAELLRKNADLREILSVPPLDNVSIAQSGRSAGDAMALVRDPMASRVVDVKGVLTPTGVRALMIWSDVNDLL